MKVATLLMILLDLQQKYKLAQSAAVFPAPIEICSLQASIELLQSGKESSLTIYPRSYDWNRPEPCVLEIEAPESHLVHMQFGEKNLEIHRAMANGRRPKHPPCILNVFLKENESQPVWSGDLCSIDYLPHVDLLTPSIKFVWHPPGDVSYVKGRKIILTTVGKGDICKRADQHTCMRIGWEPAMCISDHLLCDGIQHCPKGSATSDEDDDMCRNRLLSHSSWKQVAVDILKKIKPPPGIINNKWLMEKSLEEENAEHRENADVKDVFTWKDWKELMRNDELTSPTPLSDSTPITLNAILSQYGPWGYLLLGILACCSLLIFCGLWELCVRRHKSELTLGGQQSSSINHVNYEHVQTTQPPEYDDLDLPPSYSILYPHGGENKTIDLHPEDLNVASETRQVEDEGSVIQMNETCLLNGESSNSSSSRDD